MDNINIGSTILGQLGEPQDENGAIEKAAREVDAAAGERASQQVQESQSDNSGYFQWFVTPSMDENGVSDEYQKRYDELKNYRADFTDESDALAFVRASGFRYGIDDPSGDWILDKISAVDRKGKIEDGTVNALRREYTPIEKANLMRDSIRVIESFATEGADGLMALYHSRAGRPLGLDWSAYKSMKEKDPAALVRAIRDSGFYGSQTKMQDVLGLFYDYDKGTYDEAREIELKAVQDAAANGSPAAGFGLEWFIASRQAKGEMTSSDEDKARLGKERANAMIAEYENDTANARNVFGAAISAIKIQNDPRLGEYWTAYSSARKRDTGISEAGAINQRGDVDALVAEIRKDWDACKSESEFEAVKRRFDDICEMVAQDDNREGFAHKEGIMSRAGAFVGNTIWQSASLIPDLAKGATEFVSEKWDKLFDCVRRIPDKEAKAKQFERFAKNALDAAARQGIYSEGTAAGQITDEIANLAVFGIFMRGFSATNIARTTGKALIAPAKLAEKAGVAMSKVNLLAKPGKTVLRFADKIDPAVHAAYKKEVADNITKTRTEIEKTFKFVRSADDEITLGAEKRIAELEKSIAKAEKYLHWSVGQDVVEWMHTVANELPSVAVMTLASAQQKHAENAYEIGKKMGPMFKQDLLDVAETYEIGGAAAENAVFLHIPRIFMNGVQGLTKSKQFNSACKNVYTRFQRMMESGDTIGARCLWDTLGVWQMRIAFNSLKGGATLGAVSAIDNAGDNYLKDRLKELGCGTIASVPTADGSPFYLDETKNIFGDYLTTAARASAAMHITGTGAGARGAIRGSKGVRNAYLDFRSMKNVEHAEVAALAYKLMKAKGNTVTIDGKTTAVGSTGSVYDNLPSDQQAAEKTIRGYLEANKEAYDDIHNTISGYVESVVKAAARGKSIISPAFRDRMRMEIGEKATGFIEDVFTTIGRDASPYKAAAIGMKADAMQRQFSREFAGERMRIGEYGAKDISDMMSDVFGVRVKHSTVDEDGAYHFYINPDGEMKEGKKGLIKDGEIVIKDGKLEILAGGKYDSAWAKEAVESVMTSPEFAYEAYDNLRARLNAMTDKERADAITDGTPSSIIGDIARKIQEEGGGTHGVHSIDGRKSIVTMNIDEVQGQTRAEISHEVAHGLLEQMRQSGVLKAEDDAALKSTYGGIDTWEEKFVSDILNEYINRTNEGLAGKAFTEFEKQYGEGKATDVIRERIKGMFDGLGAAIKKARDSFIREEEIKSDIERFVENRVSKAKASEEVKVRREESSAKQAEIISEFDRALGEKVKEGERVSAEEAAEVKRETSRKTISESDIAASEGAGEGLQKTEQDVAKEDAQALIAAGYARLDDGSWVCEKGNPIEWHAAMLKSAREKISSGKELTDDERSHLGVMIDETGNTVGFVQSSDTRITGDAPYVFIDERGNKYARCDVYVAPFPADASQEFMTAASDALVGQKYMISANGDISRAPTDSEIAKSRKAFVDWVVDNKAEWEKKNSKLKLPYWSGFIPDWMTEAVSEGNRSSRVLTLHLKGGATVGIKMGFGTRTFGGKKIIAKHICLPNGTAYAGGFSMEELAALGKKLEGDTGIDYKIKTGLDNRHEIHATTYSGDMSRNDGRIDWTIVYNPLSKEINTIFTNRSEAETKGLVEVLTHRANLATRRNSNASTENSVSYFGEVRQEGGETVPANVGDMKELGAENAERMRAISRKANTRFNWLPEDVRLDLTEVPISRPTEADARKFNIGAGPADFSGIKYNITGLRGIARIIGQKEANKIEADVEKIFKSTYSKVFSAHKSSKTRRGGTEKPRMWEIEKKAQDKAADIVLNLGGKNKKLIVHFTGAGTDTVPRFEYEGNAASVKKTQIEILKSGESIKVQDVISDAFLKAAYPHIANADIVVAKTASAGAETAIISGNGWESGSGIVTKVINMPVRQKIVTDKGESRDLTCVAQPPKILGGDEKPRIIVFLDSISMKPGKGNKKEEWHKALEKDLNRAIVELIAVEEGWRNPKRFSLKDWDKTGRSIRNAEVGISKDSKNEKGGTIDGLYYKVFALFGDPKLSLANKNSLLNTVIDKYISQYVTKRGAASDAPTAKRVKEIIIDTLSTAYQKFAGVLEGKAWASRMGMKESSLSKKSDALVDIDKEGLVETKAGRQSVLASEKVIDYYEKEIAEKIDKIFGKMFSENDKTFKELFREERQKFYLERQAEAAAREFNPIKVRTQAEYAAYLAYCKSHGIKPRDKEDVLAYRNYAQQTGIVGDVGRKRVANKVEGNIRKSVDEKIRNGDDSDATLLDTMAAGTSEEPAAVGPMKAATSSSSLASAISEVDISIGGKKVTGENGEDLWLTEKNMAIDEIVEMLKSGKVGKNRAMTKMAEIVAAHSTDTSTDKVMSRVSEIAADVAAAMGKKFSISARGTSRIKSVDDYMVEAAAAKMAKNYIWKRGNKVDNSIKEWVKRKAKGLRIPESEIDSYADSIFSKATDMANKCVDELRDISTAGDVKRILNRVSRIDGISRDIASAFAYGNNVGQHGEHSTEMAKRMSDRIIKRQERDARGVSVTELATLFGTDVIEDISSICREGGKYADGDSLATALVKNFSDVIRSRKEFASMNDEEFTNDSRVRQELAMTAKAWMREAAKHLAYGKMRRDLEVDAARIAADSSAAPTFEYIQSTIQDFADRLSMYIKRHGTNETASLINKIDSFITKRVGNQDKPKGGELLAKRKFDPNQQEYWGYVRKAMRMGTEEASARIDALRAELELSHGDIARIAGEASKEVDADGVLESRHAKMLELNALIKYGGLKEKSYGEIRDVFDTEISGDLSGNAAEFEKMLAQKETKYKSVIKAFSSELGSFRDRGGQSFNDIQNRKPGATFLIGSIADLFKRMQVYLHEGSDAYETVEEFRRSMSLAHIKRSTFVMNWERELRTAVKEIYGKDFEKVIEDLSIKKDEYSDFSRTSWEIDKATGAAKEGGIGSQNLPTRLSKGNLIYIYMARRQADMLRNNEVYGCDALYMSKLRNTLDAKDIMLAEWLTTAYERIRGEVSPVSERVTGLKVLSPVENYSPLEFIHSHISGESNKYSTNPFPSFLTRRRGHDIARLNEAQDPIRMFENRIGDSGHYIAFGEIMQDAIMTFKDARVQNAYAQVLGTKAKNDMYAQLSEALSGGRKDTAIGLNGIRNFITASSLFYNVGSAVKQLEGIGGWAVEMGVMPWLKGIIVNKATSAEIRQGMRELEESGIFAARQNEEISEAMVALANSMDGVRHGLVSRTYNWYKRHGMDLTKFIDKISSQSLAAQYYTMRKKFYLTESGGGCSEEIARERAVADTDYAIQTTQQSGRPEFLHYAQRSGTVGRVMTQFSGPAFVRWGIEIDALHRAFIMGDAGAKRKLFSKMAAMHLVCGPILALAGGVTNMIMKDVDDDNDEIWENTYRDVIVNMMSGPMTGWFIFGQVGNAGMYSLHDKFIADKSYGHKRFETPILSKLGSLQSKTIKAFDDVVQFINCGDIDAGMIEDIREDADDLLLQLVPAYRSKNIIDTAKEAIQ